MDEKKTSVIALLRVLEKYSDENHIIGQPELLNHLYDDYNIIIDRRTLYKNIDMLQAYGFDISTFNENGSGYYLREREFEPSEIFLLCNAIHASNYIPKGASEELINKLLKTQSVFFVNDFKNTVFVENNKKKDNKEFFLNIELISEAIKRKKSISFNYTHYDFDKKLVNRRKEPYILSPYYLVYNTDKTYLIGKSKNHDNLIHFRVDRMKNIKIVDDKYLRLSRNEDPYEYAKSKVYMFTGDKDTIVVRCDNVILDDIIDMFGKDITVVKDDDKHFIAYINGSKEGMVYYALQYAKYLEVLKPEPLRNEIKNILKDTYKKYEKNT